MGFHPGSDHRAIAPGCPRQTQSCSCTTSRPRMPVLHHSLTLRESLSADNRSPKTLAMALLATVGIGFGVVPVHTHRGLTARDACYNSELVHTMVDFHLAVVLQNDAKNANWQRCALERSSNAPSAFETLRPESESSSASRAFFAGTGTCTACRIPWQALVVMNSVLAWIPRSTRLRLCSCRWLLNTP